GVDKSRDQPVNREQPAGCERPRGGNPFGRSEGFVISSGDVFGCRTARHDKPRHPGDKVVKPIVNIASAEPRGCLGCGFFRHHRADSLLGSLVPRCQPPRIGGRHYSAVSVVRSMAASSLSASEGLSAASRQRLNCCTVIPATSSNSSVLGAPML